MSLFSFAARAASQARTLLAPIGATLLLTLTAGAARADLKVVAKTTVGERSTTVTTYYKGSKARVETGNSVIITDGSSGKTYILNPQKKTYTLIRANDPNMQQASGMMQMFDISADVKPGGKSKTILGKTVKNYVFTITMKPNAAFKTRMDEAKKKNPNAQIPPIANMVVTVRGEEWVSDALGVSAAGNAVMMQQLMSMPNFRNVAQKFSIMKGVSLESNTSTSFGTQSQTSKTVATSVSQSPLSDSLFDVPVGYKLEPMGAASGGRPGMGRPAAPAPR